jgi:hypothetical protein
MALADSITFVVAVNDRKIFAENFLSSPCLSGPRKHQFITQEGFRSAAAAYNEAIDRADNDLIVFVHQDVFLPEPWVSDLQKSLDLLQKSDADWGVLGCWGVTQNRREHGYAYTTKWGLLGRPFDYPVLVQTLDEFVLILRKSSGLRFDPTLPHFHFYGTDICMAAAANGRASYAISALCIHNTTQIFVFPKEFYDCYRHVKRVWNNHLPIQTSCTRISRLDLDLRVRGVKQFVGRVFNPSYLEPMLRAADPAGIWEKSLQRTLLRGKK